MSPLQWPNWTEAEWKVELAKVKAKHLGDFDGHPFRGNQYTDGEAVAKAMEHPHVVAMLRGHEYATEAARAFAEKHGPEALIEAATWYANDQRGPGGGYGNILIDDMNAARKAMMAEQRKAKKAAAAAREPKIRAQMREKHGYDVGDTVFDSETGTKGTVKWSARDGQPYVESTLGNKHLVGSRWKKATDRHDMGDFEGHPFRGNQYTDVAGAGHESGGHHNVIGSYIIEHIGPFAGIGDYAPDSFVSHAGGEGGTRTDHAAVRVFIGTNHLLAEHVREHGIKVNRPSPVTRSLKEAQDFAREFTRHYAAHPAVIELRVPRRFKDVTVQDEPPPPHLINDVPPEWIGAVHYGLKARNAWRSLSDDGDTESFFLPVFVKSDSKSLRQDLFDDAQPRDDHGRWTDGAPGAMSRAEKVAKINELLGEMKAKFSAPSGLTATEAKEYEHLASQIDSHRFDIARPMRVEQVPDQAALQSTLNPATVVAAQHDLLRNKDIFMAIASAAHGSHFDAPTAVDEILLGRNARVSPEQFRENFAATRAALQAQYGDTIPVYRAVTKQGRKPTQNWATTRKFAENFGAKVVKKEIPAYAVIAVNVGLKGKYHELIVDTRYVFL